ncbi:response regulator [Myxosarcina sp. GI1(2024)]
MTKPILIVDDYDDILFLIRLTLESDGYEVRSATNGSDALKLAREIRPQLILMDIMMPGLNGLEVTKQLRQEEELSSIQILLISANHQITAEEARKSGANGILHKPFGIDNLSLQVHRSLAQNHKSLQEHSIQLV